eukprot:TRINITY_DN45117_c0_g1_i1.p2 TRINITY_DN45117_c0_g1~~TRINITY_DN45117_c0_g1_i1.p2  ORF type:complete len:182 (+),score=51.80 TRINITY_DN45117_c0_g1_i1:196-741(+)
MEKMVMLMGVHLGGDCIGDVGALCERFEAAMEDATLLRNETEHLCAERVALQMANRQAKNLLLQKHADLQESRKRCMELQGQQLDELSLEQLDGILATLENAKQGIAERQEELRQKALQELQVEKELLEDRALCCVCMSNPCSVVLMPCAHLCSCVDCVKQLSQCPLCRKDIANHIQTYIM